MSISTPIIVALDYPTAREALGFVSKITPNHCRLKVGSELFTAAGSQFVWELVKDGFDVFLDLKYHDTPNTVANACSAAADLGVWMVNVHCLGGRAMLEGASKALKNALHKPLLIGVTILTSAQESNLIEVGLSSDIPHQVVTLAKLAEDCGLDGVVCSARDCSMLRQEMGKAFQLVTPGIRLEKNTVNNDDQRRTATPHEALFSGANYLVIGRPITQAANPIKALEEITASL